jgi:hypothetical protein
MNGQALSQTRDFLVYFKATEDPQRIAAPPGVHSLELDWLNLYISVQIINNGSWQKYKARS